MEEGKEEEEGGEVHVAVGGWVNMMVLVMEGYAARQQHY